MTISGEGETTTFDAQVNVNNPNSEFNEIIRKRRGSFPQLSSEVLSAELLAPLPQANLSRANSNDQLLTPDDESKPLLKVNLL